MTAKDLPVIGTYAFCNTGSVLIHEIDPWGEWVIASINGKNPERYEITQAEMDEPTAEDDVETGFYMGEWWIPFSQVIRV